MFRKAWEVALKQVYSFDSNLASERKIVVGKKGACNARGHMIKINLAKTQDPISCVFASFILIICPQ